MIGPGIDREPDLGAPRALSSCVECAGPIDPIDGCACDRAAACGGCGRLAERLQEVGAAIVRIEDASGPLPFDYDDEPESRDRRGS